MALKFSSRDIAHVGNQSKESKGHVAKTQINWMLYSVQDIRLKLGTAVHLCEGYMSGARGQEQ